MGGYMFLAERAMFLLTRGVFAAAGNVFALCLLGERMFLLVFGPKFNEEVWWADGIGAQQWDCLGTRITTSFK